MSQRCGGQISCWRLTPKRVEIEGSGTVSFDPGAGIDQGTVTITGTGAAPDDGAPVEDFTIEATIESC